MPTPMNYDHYYVLGVPRNASNDLIKQAYRKRVKQCHPDRDPSPTAHQKFLIVQDAYSVLSNPTRRKLFDDRLLYYRKQQTAKPRENTVRTKPAEPITTDVPEQALPHFAYIGLHVTGLLFGIAIVFGISFGLTFLDWPIYMLLFMLPGLAVLPDSLAGLTRNVK